MILSQVKSYKSPRLTSRPSGDNFTDKSISEKWTTNLLNVFYVLV